MRPNLQEVATQTRTVVVDPQDWTRARPIPITTEHTVFCYSRSLDRYASRLVFWPEHGRGPILALDEPTLYVDEGGLVEAWERLPRHDAQRSLGV